MAQQQQRPLPPLNRKQLLLISNKTNSKSLAKQNAGDFLFQQNKSENIFQLYQGRWKAVPTGKLTIVVTDSNPRTRFRTVLGQNSRLFKLPIKHQKI